MPNRIIHFEIVADEAATLQSFFEDVFDWEFERWEDPEGETVYHLIMTGKEDEPGIDGGMMESDQFEQRVIAVIDVDDIDMMLDAVRGHGCDILVEKQPVPGVGWTAYFEDPDGNTFGMMQEDESAGRD